MRQGGWGAVLQGLPSFVPTGDPQALGTPPQCFVPKLLPSSSCCSLHCCVPWGHRGTEITPHFLLITFCKMRGTNASQPLPVTAPLQPHIPNQELMCNQRPLGLRTASLHPRPLLPHVVLPNPFGGWWGMLWEVGWAGVLQSKPRSSPRCREGGFPKAQGPMQSSEGICEPKGTL